MKAVDKTSARLQEEEEEEGGPALLLSLHLRHVQTLDSMKERLGLMGAMCRAGLSLVRLACR